MENNTYFFPPDRLFIVFELHRPNGKHRCHNKVVTFSVSYSSYLSLLSSVSHCFLSIPKCLQAILSVGHVLHETYPESRGRRALGTEWGMRLKEMRKEDLDRSISCPQTESPFIWHAGDDTV